MDGIKVRETDHHVVITSRKSCGECEIQRKGRERQGDEERRTLCDEG